MFGITDSDMKRITPLALRLYPGTDLGKIGAWGLLPLCCGLNFGRTFGGVSAIVEGIDPRRDSVYWLQDKANVFQLVRDFHDILATWINAPHFRAIGEEKVAQLLSGREANDEVWQYMVPYVSLGVVLQSIPGKDYGELSAIRSWAESAENGWHWMFFGAGCLLAGRNDFPGQAIYSSFIGTNAEPTRSDLKDLFQHFRRLGV